MLKKTLTFNDLINDGKITEDWYFNLDVGELTEMMMVEGEDLETKLKQIGQSQSRKEIMVFFKDMLSRSVGKQVKLGDRIVFRKNQDIRDEFFGGGAYSAFFLELVTNEETAADFINAIMPKDLEEQARKIAAKAAEKGGPEVAAQLAAAGIDIQATPEAPAQPGTDDDVSDDELRRLLEEDDATEKDNRPAWLKEGRKPTKTELVGMPRAELKLAMRLKSEGKIK